MYSIDICICKFLGLIRYFIYFRMIKVCILCFYSILNYGIFLNLLDMILLFFIIFGVFLIKSVCLLLLNLIINLFWIDVGGKEKGV